MASDWVELSLGEIAQNISRPFKFKDFEEVTFINTGDVLEGQFLHSNTVSKIGLPGQAKKEIKEGDILFSEIRPANKRFALVDFDPTGYVVSTKFMVIKKISEDIDDRFFYILLTNKITLHELQRIAESRSGTFPQITFDAIAYFPVKIPPLTEQKVIAHILGSLDDKIELNRQMNDTLETMAQALFKSWFVDFDPVIDNALAVGNAIPDELLERAEQRKGIEKKENSDIQSLFPDEFEFTEEMGWIPLGWEVTPLAALIKLTGGGTPKTSIPEYWNGDIPWFSVVDAPSSSDIFVLDTEKHVTSLGVEKSSTKILPVGTTIISARGTVGKCAMVSRPMAMNQSCYGVLGNEGISNTFVYYSVFLSVSELQSKGHGSVFNTITGDTFKSINVAFSGGRLTREFDNLVSPYFEKILTNSLQVTTLSKLRDTLLPKLMSGELRIPDAEAFVDEVL